MRTARPRSHRVEVLELASIWAEKPCWQTVLVKQLAAAVAAQVRRGLSRDRCWAKGPRGQQELGTRPRRPVYALPQQLPWLLRWAVAAVGILGCAPCPIRAVLGTLGAV